MVPNRGEGLVFRTTIACGVLETVAVVLRLLAQWKNNRRLYRDDWWIVASLVPSYAMLAVGMLSKLFILARVTKYVLTLRSGYYRWRRKTGQKSFRCGTDYILKGNILRCHHADSRIKVRARLSMPAS